jgi:hypothetical protein
MFVATRIGTNMTSLTQAYIEASITISNIPTRPNHRLCQLIYNVLGLGQEVKGQALR